MTDTRDPLVTAVLDIEGMTCASCVARVERRLERVEGVEASVSLATASAQVRHPASVGADVLVDAVRSAGYDARARTPERPVAAEPPRDPLRARLWGSALLAVPVVAVSMVPAWQFPGWQWVLLALTTPIVVWGGWPFHRAAAVNLRHGGATMDTLVSMGTLSAYLWSLGALLFGSAGTIGLTHEVVLFGPVHDPGALVYFEVAAAVTVFLLAGRVVEHRSTRRAGAALRSLMSLAADDVERVDGARIPASALRVGERFLVRSGERVAADGVVVDGAAAVDQSMLTGEAMPVSVGVGDAVTGGTIATGGLLTVEATGVGADTRLARIARLVEDAQANKSAVQRLADRISAVFVPIVIALAVATFAGWMLAGRVDTAVSAAVAVLIIACPCALGLATPIAILVGTGRAAQLGVLITGPDAIERADRVDTIFIDKTGTLTEGRMRVGEVRVADGVDRERALHLLASLEHGSEHPLARALGALADERSAVSDVVATPGLGIVGTVDGARVFAVRADAADRFGAIDQALRAALDAPAAPGATVVAAGWDGRVALVATVEDAVREDAADVVAALAAGGRRDIVLLTGDAAPAARAVAARVGIAEVVAGVGPEQKLAALVDRQRAGHVVAMVGDGVNDAAALAAADLGIALGGGTDAAMRASDITLSADGIAPLVRAVSISRRTMRVIRQNLFWAFAYNVAALPLAAAGLLNPMLAGAAMACSSVFVVLNSLRLRALH